MKHLLFWAVFALGSHALAEDIAVLAKNQLVVGADQASGAIPADAGQRAFLEHFRASVREKSAWEAALPLVNPPDWGKTISAATHGEIKYHRAFAHGFVGHLSLQGLRPRHTYILTLNGKPDKPGNDLLPLRVPGMERERYYDFLFIASDAAGSYESTLGIYLKTGPYDVRIYVKDTDDFKIVLYRDYFPFTVD